MSSNIYFDSETGPLLEKVLDFNKPFKEFEPLGGFDATAVKVGALKDTDKIKAKIDAARIGHDQAVVDHLSDYNAKSSEYWAGLNEKAALSPETGEILVIGIINLHGTVVMCEHTATEKEVLAQFWSVFTSDENRNANFVGWNIFEFDLPYIVTRSRILGVKVPPGAFSITNGRWVWNNRFIDLMPLQSCGVWAKKFYKLSKAAKLYGVDCKRDYEVEGKDFHKYWKSDKPSDLASARAYLTDDLLELAGIDKFIRG